MNGACFDLADDDFDDSYANGTSSAAVDPAFRKIKKNCTTFLVWRIENLNVVAVPKEQYGIFFDEDSYIIYAATQYGQHSGPNTIPKELRCPPEYHIHFWLGKGTSTDKAGVAAYKTVEFDGYLGGAATQHREVQGSESPRFKSYFNKSGMRILSGGTTPGFKHIDNRFEPGLYQVKGKRAPIVTQLPSINWCYFNSGDVFLLHAANAIFVWVGRTANHSEKLHATKAAMKLKEEFNIKNIVFVDDGYEKTLFDRDLREFEIYLPLNKRHVKPGEEDIDDENAEQNYRANIKLYQCSDSSGKYRVTEVKSGPLKQSDLISDDVFILDHNTHGIWVWVGKRANDKERTEAMRNARGFVKKKKYPSTTAVTRVVEWAEPFEFKMLFVDWKDKDESLPLVKGMIKPVATVKVTKYDAETMYDRPALAAQSQLIDDGSGTLRKWTMKRTVAQEIPKERNSVFFVSDTYILMYTYKYPKGERTVLYYWLGLHSSSEEQGTALLKTLEMDFDTGVKTQISRVIQGREPPHFLQLMKGRMRIFSGKASDFDPTGRNMKTPNHYLLQIEGSTTYNTKGTQVELKASSLNSNYCFILRKAAHYFVWCGNNSNGDNREMAKAYAGTDFQLILEGKENPEFWHSIGGKDTYFTSKINPPLNEPKPPRLFQCTTYSGILKSEEILNFTQHDLTPEDILILDAHIVIYLWTGSLCSKIEKNMSLQTAIEYLKSDPTFRDKHTTIQQIKQGHEPPTFTGFFENWDDNLWNDHKTYFELREEIETDNNNAGSRPVHKIPDEFDQYPKYPIAVLVGSMETLPGVVDPLKKEVYLTYDDFLTLTNMTYNSFKNLPYWKQQEVKKKVGLF